MIDPEVKWNGEVILNCKWSKQVNEDNGMVEEKKNVRLPILIRSSGTRKKKNQVQRKPEGVDRIQTGFQTYLKSICQAQVLQRGISQKGILPRIIIVSAMMIAIIFHAKPPPPPPPHTGKCIGITRPTLDIGPDPRPKKKLSMKSEKLWEKKVLRKCSLIIKIQKQK